MLHVHEIVWAYIVVSCAIWEFLRWFYLGFGCTVLHMQLDEIKCTLLHKIAYFIFARVVKRAQNWLFINAVCAIFFSAYLANISHFALFFASLDNFSLIVCIKHGFTGMLTRCVHVFNYTMRKTLSSSLLPFRLYLNCFSDEWEFS